MLFNSFVFLLFLAIVLPLHRVTSRRWRNVLLLVASYVFYGYWDWRFLGLLAVSTLVDFAVATRLGRCEDPATRRRLLAASVVVNLGILGFFKYFNFFVDSFAALAGRFGIHLDFLHLRIILPVGISFYTFQTMSYTIDVYRRRMEPTRSLLDFALYVAFFPQLVAGPIERAVHLLPQIAARPRATRDDLRAGAALITLGMFRKVLVGDSCGRLVDQVFAAPDLYASPEKLAALFLFAIQIYADFSGYSHIARGTARLLGVHLMENFEQPYLAASITEFWRRWHISLSSWLRDYLYIPLGGNRRGRRRTYVNLFTTMLLGGLWHGANWTFVFWGGLHGLYLAAHKLMLGERRPAERYAGAGVRGAFAWGVRVVATFLLVLLTWLFFRAPDFRMAFGMLGNFLHWSAGHTAHRLLVMCAAYALVTLAFDAAEYATRDHAWLLRIPAGFRWGAVSAMWLVTLLYMFQTMPMPFIYFQF